MAATITGFASPDFDFWTNHLQGPYISSDGYYYAFSRDGSSATTIRAMKAADPNSSWSSAATKTGFTTAAFAVSAYQVGDTVHLLILDGTVGSSQNWKYLTFDMSTDTFVLSETIASGLNPGTTNNACDGCIVVRSTGEAVVGFGGQQLKISGSYYPRLYWSRRTGTNTWTSPALIDSDTVGSSALYFISGVLGADDRVHFIWDETGSYANHRSLDNTNTLDTFAELDLGIEFAQVFISGLSYDSSGTTKVIVANSEYYGTGPLIFDSGANPTLTAGGPVHPYGGYETSDRIFVDTSRSPPKLWLLALASGVSRLWHSTDEDETWQPDGGRYDAGYPLFSFTSISSYGSFGVTKGQNSLIVRDYDLIIPVLYADQNNSNWYYQEAVIDYLYDEEGTIFFNDEASFPQTAVWPYNLENIGGGYFGAQLGPFRSSTGHYYILAANGNAIQVGDTIHMLAKGGTVFSVAKADGDDPASTWTLLHKDINQGGDSVSLYYYTFDLSTEDVGITGEVVEPQDTTGGLGSGAIVVRSTGEVVIFYPGPMLKVSGVNYRKLYYKRRTAADTWTARVLVSANAAEHAMLPAACLGASDRVHFVWGDTFGYSPPGSGFRSLSSSNVLDTGMTGCYSDFDGPIYTSDTGKVHNFFVNYADNSLYYTSWTSQADPSDATQVQIVVQNATYGAFKPSRQYYQASTGRIFVIYAGAPSGGFDNHLWEIHSDDNGANWSTPTIIYSGLWNTPGSQGLDHPYLGYGAKVYDRGGDIGPVVPFTFHDAHFQSGSGFLSVRYYTEIEISPTQDLTAGHVSADDAFYVPTIIFDQIVEPTLYDDASTFIIPFVHPPLGISAVDFDGDGPIFENETYLFFSLGLQESLRGDRVAPHYIYDDSVIHIPVIEFGPLLADIFNDQDNFYSPEAIRALSPPFISEEVIPQPSVSRQLGDSRSSVSFDGTIAIYQIEKTTNFSIGHKETYVYALAPTEPFSDEQIFTPIDFNYQILFTADLVEDSDTIDVVSVAPEVTLELFSADDAIYAHDVSQIGGIETQELQASLYSDVDEVFSPTFTWLNEIVSPDYSSDDQLISLEITNENYLAAPAIDGDDTAYEAVVGSPLDPALIESDDAIYATTLDYVPVHTLQPLRYTAGDVTYAALITREVFASLYEDAEDFLTPGAGFSVAPSETVPSDDAFFAPRIDRVLEPTLFSYEVFFSPVARSVSSILPNIVSDLGAIYTPVSITHYKQLQPSHYSAVDIIYAASLPVPLYAGLVSDPGTIHAAAIGSGMQPQRHVDADIFRSPTVQRGAVTIAPQRHIESDILQNPVISTGEKVLEAPTVSAPDVFLRPTITSTVSTALVIDSDAILPPQLGAGLTPSLLVDGDTVTHPLALALNEMSLLPMEEDDLFFSPDNIFWKRFRREIRKVSGDATRSRSLAGKQSTVTLTTSKVSRGELEDA